VEIGCISRVTACFGCSLKWSTISKFGRAGLLGNLSVRNCVVDRHAGQPKTSFVVLQLDSSSIIALCPPLPFLAWVFPLVTSTPSPLPFGLIPSPTPPTPFAPPPA